MIRFALTVTGIELALTAVAAFLVSATVAPEPYLTRSDLASLGIECESHQTERRWKLHAPASWESRARLPDGQALSVSFRREAVPPDFDLLRTKALGAGEGQRALIDEPFPGERGYAMRLQGPDGVRFELVRERGAELLIVRASRDAVSGLGARIALATCDKRARLVQQLMLDKLRWRQ